MTTALRRLLCGAMVVVVTSLTATAGAADRDTPQAAPGEQGAPRELRYVPAEAAVVAYVNVQALRGASGAGRLARLGPALAGPDAVEPRLGIDLARDVDLVVAGLVGDRVRGGFALLRGHVDTVALEARALAEGAEADHYRGRRVIGPLRQGARGATGLVAILEPDLVAVGDDWAVRRVVDVAAGDAPDVTTSAVLMPLVHEAAREPHAWAVGRSAAWVEDPRLPERVRTQMPAVEWLLASGHLDGGVSGFVKMEARDEATAGTLRDAVRGLLALAQLQSPARPELQGLWQTVEISGTGRTVAISFAWPLEVLDAVLSLRRRAP